MFHLNTIAMKKLRLITVAIAVAILSIAFGCDDDEDPPDHGTLPSMNTGESVLDEEEQYPNSQAESVPCDTLCSSDGFEFPKEKE